MHIILIEKSIRNIHKAYKKYYLLYVLCINVHHKFVNNSGIKSINLKMLIVYDTIISTKNEMGTP